MKIYFNASPRKLDQQNQYYQRIGAHIEKLGHSLTSRWILDFNPDFYDTPKEVWADHYRDIIKQLDKSDIAIFDISVSSTSSGQSIQYALMQKKPVIALQNWAKPNIFLSGAGEVESKLVIVKYDHTDLEKKIEYGIDYVSDWLESRFTLILDGKTRRILDKVAQSGKSRSEFIRNLITQSDIP